jgi:hypothetical protein
VKRPGDVILGVIVATATALPIGMTADMVRDAAL